MASVRLLARREAAAAKDIAPADGAAGNTGGNTRPEGFATLSAPVVCEEGSGVDHLHSQSERYACSTVSEFAAPAPPSRSTLRRTMNRFVR
jgi:hypothetical protein